MTNLSRTLLGSLALLGAGCIQDRPSEPTEPTVTGPAAEPVDPSGEAPLTGEPSVYEVRPAGGVEAPIAERPSGTAPAPLASTDQRVSGEAGVGAGERDLQRSVGTIQGAVRTLDYERGRLVLDTGEGQVMLHARPLDMAVLNPGEVVSVSYGDYEGNWWVVPDGRQALDSFAVNGTVTGTVSSVDKSSGRFTIRGETLRAHPEAVEQLVPGQFVHASYARVAGTDWVEAVSPTTRGPEARQGIRKASSARER